MSDEGVVISERRLDWVTCFASHGSRADALEERALTRLDNEVGDGNTVRASGFEGFYGQGTKHIFVGRRADGVLARAGGPTASEIGHHLIALSTHVSRLDYCVTIWNPAGRADYADDIWELGQADDKDSPRMPTVTRTQKRWGGYTTYVGSRKSPVMARVYDKHAESKGEYLNGSWRFELELKGFASEQEATHLLADPQRECRAPSIVGQQLARWGVVVPWNSSSDIELWRTPPRISDLDRTAGWLSAQYTKTAQRYVERYGRERFLELFGVAHENYD